jgi:hypothetical protein
MVSDIEARLRFLEQKLARIENLLKSLQSQHEQANTMLQMTTSVNQSSAS